MQPRTVSADAGEIALGLRRTTSILGAIVDESGKPVSAAKIDAHDSRGTKIQSAHSTHQGRFELHALTPGETYTLHAAPGSRSDWHPPRLDPFVPTKVERVTAGTRDLVLRVRAGGKLGGRILDPTGKLVDNAAVIALGRKKGGRPPSAKTFKDGRFALTGVSKEHTELLVVARGLAPSVVPLTDSGDDLTVRLERGGTLRALFLKPDRTPLRDHTIHLWARGDAEATIRSWYDRAGPASTLIGGRLAFWGKTDEQGRITIAGLLPGAYVLAPIRLTDGVSRPTTVRPGAEEMMLILAAPSKITGRIVDEAGNPPEWNPEIAGWLNALQDGINVGESELSRDGTFEVGLLPPGHTLIQTWLGPAYHLAKVEAEAGDLDVTVVVRRRP
jgi:protocatechuate 3,4-dioxygenase beta subunit